MAFSFNWSPLTADASFYTRAQELLTAALNKSPKPPIIVDDILVNELNLGSVPPDLEILEVGDLAEDRFRGIFKMCYRGDAFLTLKTRVQANPLNTYLSTKPSFASPQPLAASSGLTIPLQITLSEFKLSAFIILVFSRQKGITLVFRNDPLESLKVSSTFDSIPFVRDYLQKEIEGQLRTLLMDEVPVIIHRLSLRLWVPEYRDREDEELARHAVNSPAEEKVTDPLASPPHDPVDMFGIPLNPSQIASLSLDSSLETHSLFSQKNLLRLAALSDCHRTLSLSTPGMRDVVFRAWAGPTERGEKSDFQTPITPFNPSVSRSQFPTGSSGISHNLSHNIDVGSTSTRPTLSSHSSYAPGLNSGTGKSKGHGHRKRKNRVINLRTPKSGPDDMSTFSGEDTFSGTTSSAASEDGGNPPASAPLEQTDELVTPPQSPKHRFKFQNSPESIDGNTPPRIRNLTPRPPPPQRHRTLPCSSTAPPIPTPSIEPEEPATVRKRPPMPSSRNYIHNLAQTAVQPPVPPSSSSSARTAPHTLGSPFPYPESSSSGGILEQAWMMKMAGEIARRVQDEKDANNGLWDRGEREDTPPPAYGS